MPEEMKLPELIENALGYSRNYATAKPNIGNTEKEHILGLANLLEKTALEVEALRKDAERYRWLRDPDNQENLEPDSDYLMPPIICGYAEHEDILAMASLDSAIDAALAQEVQP